MAGQTDFLESIRELERIAQTNGNQLSMEEIESYFADMHLAEKQLDYICRYLESHQIYVENRVARGQDEFLDEDVETKGDPLDEEMVSLYVKETESASHLSDDQETMIVRKLMNGDENARNLLIEANLTYAVELAREYTGQGLLLSDLIQESNIGLMVAVNDFEPSLDRNFAVYKEKVMRQHIENALEEYNQSTRSAMKMASRVNELNEIATAFAKEYEREAKPGELAQRMGITEEEVKELMKVSLDAIAVLDQGKID